MAFAEINDKHIQNSATGFWRNLAICRRGSEWLVFLAFFGFLLKSMINIYKSLLNLCGGNRPFVGVALSGWVFSQFCGFCWNQ